ncbi:hypothetical protein SNEBB_003778, partial [Seison nebaliae]
FWIGESSSSTVCYNDNDCQQNECCLKSLLFRSVMSRGKCTAHGKIGSFCYGGGDVLLKNIYCRCGENLICADESITHDHGIIELGSAKCVYDEPEDKK